MTASSPQRTEHDLLGTRLVPEAALWGIHTARAIENFPVSGYRTPPALLKALAHVKKACCLANAELGFLPGDTAAHIQTACDEIAEGRFNDQFPLDALQGGAGTSTNMNMNEVIANRALELGGFTRGDYSRIHPIEHVNLHQSTNDVYPTALKIAAIRSFRSFSTAAETLQGTFQSLENKWADFPIIGKTELMDAVPMTLGKIFSAHADAVARDRWRAFKCEERLRTVNLGGTAVGTGLTAPRSYIFLVIEKLREVTGLGLARGENTVDQTANADAFVEVSATLKAAACNLEKIARDLRLMHARGEIHLPPVQAGSSIMPGKVNPVICESVIQCAMKVHANDLLVGLCAGQGSLQINEFLPLLGFALLESLALLENAFLLLAHHAEALSADPEACRRNLDASPSLITAFLPLIGYERGTELAQAFQASGETDLRAFLVRELGEETVNTVLAPQRLTALGYAHAKHT
ncbi:MAG: aspartate ammonia-lyase [Kiritimatiellae bacterium]|nr:aspartate ammonia-lyase [Kiritimatiellia bacterium]